MVRINSAQVIRQTLEQGLVTPGSSVPTIIAMSTDSLSTVRTRVETLIRDMNTKYKGLILVRFDFIDKGIFFKINNKWKEIRNIRFS